MTPLDSLTQATLQEFEERVRTEIGLMLWEMDTDFGFPEDKKDWIKALAARISENITIRHSEDLSSAFSAGLSHIAAVLEKAKLPTINFCPNHSRPPYEVKCFLCVQRDEREQHNKLIDSLIQQELEKSQKENKK